jgi:hypothetical protein
MFVMCPAKKHSVSLFLFDARSLHSPTFLLYLFRCSRLTLVHFSTVVNALSFILYSYLLSFGFMVRACTLAGKEETNGSTTHLFLLGLLDLVLVKSAKKILMLKFSSVFNYVHVLRLRSKYSPLHHVQI